MLDKNLQRVKISQVIGNQIPDFIAEENPLFTEFLEQYYRSQDSQGLSADIAENLDQYLSINNFDETKVLVSETKLSSDIKYYSETISVESTASWPDQYGLLKIDNEIITYTGKTETSFTGCVRGFSGIEDLHNLNDYENLIFSDTESADHTSGAVVYNLSNLFLKEFWKKLKTQFLPGFENRNLYTELRKGFFLTRGKDFYQTKGTDESLKILFKVLYGDEARIIKPQDYMIKPSSAEWSITHNIIAEKVSGDPLLIKGEILRQDSPTVASGYIYDSEFYSLEDNNYFVIRLSPNSIVGNFVVNGFTKNVVGVTTTDGMITVDSTVGFDKSGELYVDGNVISYTHKNSTQFLGCTGITSSISIYSGIHQNNFVYSYESGDLTKKVQLRVTGTLSDYNLEASTVKYLSVGDEISVKRLGEKINRGEYNSKFDNWIYNPVTNVRLLETTSKFSSTSSPTFVTTKTTHNFRIGDSITLVSDSGSELSGTVSDVLYTNAEDQRKNISTKFEFTFSTLVSLDKSVNYTARRNVLTASSSAYPEVNGYFANIQNTYIDKKKENLYVTSTGLPSYQIDAPSVEKSFTSTESSSDVISFVNPHNFFTGQKVYLQTLSGNITGLSSQTSYFVKKVNNNSIQLAFNPTKITEGDFISFSGIGTHLLSPNTYVGKTLQDQNLLKKIPIVPQTKEKDLQLKDITSSKITGILLNGVEIHSSESGDQVWYGQINGINVLNGGSGYDVLNPPSITFSDSTGTGCEATAIVSGSIEEIVLTDAGYDFKEVPIVNITGGNGRNATAQARLKGFQFSANFNGGPSGVSTSGNTIGFGTFHTFKNGDEVVYQSLGNAALGIGNSSASTSVDSYLINNASYFVRKVDDTTIQLMTTKSDSLVGLNTISLNSESSGNHRLFERNIRKVIDYILVTNPGEGYSSRTIDVSSIKYPPEFPGISTAFVGINTEDHYIFAKNHGFSTGEEVRYSTTGDVITGLSTDKTYYALKIDDSKFKLVEKFTGISTVTGIGTTVSNEYLNSKNYIKFSGIGTGSHTFKYPEIKVTIEGSLNTTLLSGISTIASAFPIVKGSISDVFVKSGGSKYGSEILNFKREPDVKIGGGELAIIGVRVVNGEISNAFVIEEGRDYNSEPELIVKGSGKFAQLKANVADGKIISVDVIDGGRDYLQKDTTVEIKVLGSGVKVSADIQKWVINSYSSYSYSDDGGIIVPAYQSDFGKQFLSITAPKKLRRTLGDNLDAGLNEIGINTAHSPIIGWCYDGNPIYGPYGGNLDSSENNPREMVSGYTSILRPNRPSTGEFPVGSFIEDYTYTASGDLDQHNGRFCKTPDFPNGTYAYFATKQNYPYIVKSFRNKVDEFNYSFVNDQRSGLLDSGTIFRNTTPYKIKQRDAFYEGLNDFSNKDEKYVVTSTIKTGITSVRVVEGGLNYKVGDRVSFINETSGGDGATAEVESLSGQTITSIDYTESKYPNIEFSYSGSTVTGLTTVPHDIIDNQTVVISGISSDSFKKLEGSFKVGVSSVVSTLITGIGLTSVTGITTTVILSEPTTTENIRANDSLTIGSEKLLVLNPLGGTNAYRVLRAYDGSTASAHDSGDSVSLNPRRFTYEVPNLGTNLVIRENKETYFNPETSVGYGTDGTRYFVGYGVSYTTTGIQTGTTTRLFFKSHSFSPTDLVEISGGSPAGINTTEVKVISVGSTFVNVQYDSDSITGVGTQANVLLRNTRFVPAKSIYIPCLSCGCESIPFQTFEPFTYFTNTGIGISVSEYDDLSNAFQLVDGQTIYVTRLSEASDTIGIRTTRTGIGSLSTLYFTGSALGVGVGTTGGTNHSIKTLNPNVTGTLNKFVATVTTELSHGISTSNTINLNVVPDRTETNTVKYNSSTNSLVLNPITFTSSNIGVGTTVSNINLTSHGLRTGDKVIYSTDGTSASNLENNRSYYVIKDSNDYIRLSETYSDSVRKIPKHINILSSGSGNHEISLINPRISVYRGNSLQLDVSDSSLVDLKIRFYLDSNFINEYSTDSIIRTGDTGVSGSTVQLQTNSNTPKTLYYYVTQENISDGDEYKVFVDKEVKDFSKITLNTSIYNGEFTSVGVSSDTLQLILNKEPEHSSYTSSNTSTLKYSTKSPTSVGPIEKVRLISGGSAYRTIPRIDGVVSSAGTGAILRPFSDEIGSINNVSPVNLGYNYSADNSIVVKAEAPTILEIVNNFTLSEVGVSSGGKGYLVPPVPIVVGYPNIILESKLSGTSVFAVDIITLDGGLSEVTPEIVSTQNTNGILVTSAESNGSQNTLTLKRPNNGFTNFPFALGDKVFVEGIETTTVQSEGGGYNSEDYNYKTFEIVSFINDANVSSITYNIPVGLGTTGGTFDVNTSIGRAIKESDLARFNTSLIQQNFNNDETITSGNNATGKVVQNGWNPVTRVLKISNVDGEFKVGDTLVGSTSKTKGTVNNVSSFDTEFDTGSTVIKSNGWQTQTGFTNESFQRIQDSFYYQNFSYSVKSKTPYSTWSEPVNSLTHTAGFKNFSDLDVVSPADIKGTLPARVSIAASEVGPLIEIDSVMSLYTRPCFDLASDNAISDTLTRDIVLNSTKLVPYVECIDNKVYEIDDVSPQFTGVTSTIGGNVVGIASFALFSKGETLLHKSFNITNGSVIGAGSSLIFIPNHNFSTGERLVYDYGSGTPVGIATTARVLSGVSTDTLPEEVYAYKVDNNTIKLAGIKTDSTINNIFFEYRSETGIGTTVVGSGTTHTLSSHPDIANTKALITVDNIIQSPIFRKDIDTGLSENIGIGSTTFKLVGVTSITSNTLLQIEDEILKLNVVGFGSTNTVYADRAQFGTNAAAHLVGAAVTVLGGDYTINKGYVYFNSAPYGKVGLTTLNPGISTNSTFAGRVFHRVNYDTNYILDDISQAFTGEAGTGKSFSILSREQEPTGIHTNQGIILINNFFQRPLGEDTTTDYSLSTDGVSGITTITFTGDDRESLPRGGIVNEFELSAGDSYTPGSYPNVSLTGGNGSGAKVDIVVGTGGSVTKYKIIDRGIGYSENDILSFSSPSTSGTAATFTVDSVYSDEFSGWSFGRLLEINDVSSQFDGFKKSFIMERTVGIVASPFSIEIADGANFDIQNVLLVFINDVLQKPGKDYTFTGGTRLVFTEAPKLGSKCKIMFYQGSTLDVLTRIPLQTIKVGDSVQLESHQNILQQDKRVVIELLTSDTLETNPYNGSGISTDVESQRCLTWTKQTSDSIINGEIVSKNRDYLEPKIIPTTRLIKDFVPGDTVLYTQGGYPDFRILDETTEDDNNVRIISDVQTDAAQAVVSTVSTGGTITSFTITDPGVGYENSPEVTLNYRPQILEIGKNWTSGVTTTVSTTNLRSIRYQNNLYVVSDDKGGISTSVDYLTWSRQTPTFAGNNQINDVEYGNGVWVGVGSDANVGYSTDNAVNWDSSVIYSYVALNFGRYSFTQSSTTRKFQSVVYGNGKFVAVGTGATVLVSDDAYPTTTTWLESGSTPLTSSPTGIGTQWLINQSTFVDLSNNPTTAVTNDLKSVIYSDVDSRFVVVGNNGVIMSSQMGSITNRFFRVERAPSGGQENLNDIVYGDSKYVVVGNNGTVGYSTNLTGWTFDTVNTTENLLSVVYESGVFVAVGERGSVINSINGEDWFVKNSVSTTMFSLTGNTSSVIGVGSDSSYYFSDQELSKFVGTGNVSAAGTISSINIAAGGFGYSNASDISVLIEPPNPKYEDLTSVEVAGDYGKIIGIGTSATGIGTDTPMVIFEIQTDVGLNTDVYGSSSSLTPIIRSGITTGDYYTTYNTITGDGVTSIYIDGSTITNVGVGNTYLDNIYVVDQVDNNGVSGVVTVYSNVLSIVGVASTSVDPDNIGFSTTGKVGNYSWGKFYNFGLRDTPKSFSVINDNGFIGIQTSPLVIRKTALRAEYN